MMDSRSIDFAKTASIDMMALNNKVVNMRQVVKRTKVHVISKLCKNINSLKKKKGTEEQKAKNLRKAQRLIEEIDSMKRLKEDKVSKYALANVSSFSDTSKVSLSPGPRALARLADHSLMKKVVADFREQHSDWRDLAAYLLVKQTGRRFKTKKQKKIKLANCIENIQASETMTKAYIKERFGQDGLAKAELRFERKRKRPKSAAIPGSTDTTDTGSKRLRSGLESSENSVKDLIQDVMAEQDSEKTNETMVIEEERDNERVIEMEAVKVVEHEILEGKVSSGASSGSEEAEVEAVKKSKSVSTKKNKVLPQRDDSDEDSSSGESEADQIEDSGSKDDMQVDSEDHVSDVEEKPVTINEGAAKLKSECVVKELRLGGSSDDDSNDSSSSEEDASEEDVQSNSSDDPAEDGIVDNTKRKKMKKEKPIPEMLTKTSKTQLSDPFFAGSDDEGDDKVNEEVYYSDDNMFEDDFGSGSHKAKSMFYNPHSEGTYAGGSTWSQRGRRGGFERRGPPGKFDKGQRGRSFRNDGRGRGVGGSSGAGRGGNVRKFTPHQSYERNGGKTPAKQSFSTDRFNTQNTESGKSHQTHTGPASSKLPTEKLHPSWEASKKRKAEQSSLKAFKGSKITFDDDD